MAKQRKTLKQKKQSRLRQKQNNSNSSFTYSGKITTIKAIEKTEIRKEKNFNEDDILIVDPKYIRMDLTKTLFLSVFFIGLILILYWYFDLGGNLIIKI